MSHALHDQRGSAVLPGVLVILTLALMMLGAQIPRDDALRRSSIYERHGMIARQYVQSALEQGAGMAWAPAAAWQCRAGTRPAQVCVRLSGHSGRVLMRAHGAPFAFGPQITLFRYFVLPKTNRAEIMQPLAHSRIDYCPEPREEMCR